MKRKIIEPVKCICCGKEIKSLLPDPDMKYDMVDGGIVTHINAGFGSEHDGDVFQIAICDECINEKEREDRLILVGNYLFGETINHRNEIIEGK